MTHALRFLFCLSCLPIFSAGMGCQRELDIPGDLMWPAPATPSYIAQPRLASTVNGEDKLSFVSMNSLDNPVLYDRASVGNNPIELEGPHHLAASPDGFYIYFNLSNYVVNGGSGPHGAHGTGTVPGYLVKFDVRTNQQVAQTLVDRNPGDVILSTDGKLAYVSHYDLARLQMQLSSGAPATDGYSSVYIIDTASMTVQGQVSVCPTGHGMGLSPDGTKLYLTCTQSDQLAVLDVSNPSQPQILAKMPVGPAPGPTGNPAYAPYALTVYPVDGTVWISDNNSGDVRAYDPMTMQMDPNRVVVVGGIAMFSDFTADEKYLLVPHQGDDRVTAIELATLHTTVLPLPAQACLNAHALHVLPGPLVGAVIVCEGDHVMRPGTLAFIDLPPNFVGWAAHGYVEIGLFPDGVVPLPALHL